MIDMPSDSDIATTSGAIALANLEAQIDSLEVRATAGRLTIAGRAGLVDLLLLRGHVLGRIADYERAAALAEQLVRDAPQDNAAFLARARARATLHRFADALADLDIAERLGAERDTLDDERAAIFQALGRSKDALVLRRKAVGERADFTTLGALAGLHAKRGQVAEADLLFALGRRRYQGVSPFPVAMLDFQRGVMWMEQGEWEAAHTWFEAACTRVPAYVPALGHLAEVEAAQGQHDAAIARLRPLAASSDDPEYAGLLASLLNEAGQTDEARVWHDRAAARYDELVEYHAAAFADHAAEFWLTTNRQDCIKVGSARGLAPRK
ncbi:MAG TPA: tetratricopeptide repeat protein [Roseiflexaceae bacterium]|nr:tetratricopeptide repeat protein [Roseiflexaceae bacterium]